MKNRTGFHYILDLRVPWDCLGWNALVAVNRPVMDDPKTWVNLGSVWVGHIRRDQAESASSVSRKLFAIRIASFMIIHLEHLAVISQSVIEDNVIEDTIITYNTTADLLAEILFMRRPYESITGKISSHQLQRLPGKEYLSIPGFVEVRPKERRSISCNLGRLHQPSGDFGRLNLGLECVPVGR